MKHLERDARSHTSSRGLAQVVYVGLILCLLVGLLYPPAVGQAQAGFTFPVAMTFKDATAPGWVLGGTAGLTSGKTDPTGNGWLRLTNNDFSQAGYAYYNTPIPTGRGLVITFDYAAWGGSGADGLSFFSLMALRRLSTSARRVARWAMPRKAASKG